MGQKVHPYGFRLGITQDYKSNWFTKPTKQSEYSQFIAEDSAIRTMLFQQLRNFGLTDVQIYRQAEFLQVILYISKPRIFLQKFQSDRTDRGVSFSTNSKNGVDHSNSLAEKIIKTVQSTYQHSLLKQVLWRTEPFDETNKDIKSSQFHPTFLSGTTPNGENNKNSQLSVIIKRSHLKSARGIAEQIRDNLEKRTPFRRTLRQALAALKTSSSQRGELIEGVEGVKIQIAGRLNGAEMARTEWTREGRVPLHTLRAKIDFSYVPALTSCGILGVKVWVYHTNDI